MLVVTTQMSRSNNNVKCKAETLSKKKKKKKKKTQQDWVFVCIYLLGVLRRFQQCIGHVTAGSFCRQKKSVHSVGQGSVL